MKNPDKEKYNAVTIKGNASPSFSRWGKEEEGKRRKRGRRMGRRRKKGRRSVLSYRLGQTFKATRRSEEVIM